MISSLEQNISIDNNKSPQNNITYSFKYLTIVNTIIQMLEYAGTLPGTDTKWPQTHTRST